MDCIFARVLGVGGVQLFYIIVSVRTVGGLIHECTKCFRSH
jgi:hypothetical protein